MLMKECHCACVPFEKIVKIAMNSNRPYESIAKDLDAGEICTACRKDMKTYCESNIRLQLQEVL